MTSISAYPHWVTGNARNLEGASGSEVEAFDPESQDGSDTSEAVEPRLTIRPHITPDMGDNARITQAHSTY